MQHNTAGEDRQPVRGLRDGTPVQSTMGPGHDEAVRVDLSLKCDVGRRTI